MISSTTADKLVPSRAYTYNPASTCGPADAARIWFQAKRLFPTMAKAYRNRTPNDGADIRMAREEKELDGNASFARGENAASASSSMDSLLKTRLDLLRRIYRPIQDICSRSLLLDPGRRYFAPEIDRCRRAPKLYSLDATTGC